MKIPILENWSLGTILDDPYLAPELNPSCLYGEVYNHPKKEDGKRIRTSQLIEFNWENMTVQCKSRVYKLGKPDSEWITYLEKGNFNDTLQKLRKGKAI